MGKVEEAGGGSSDRYLVIFFLLCEYPRERMGRRLSFAFCCLRFVFKFIDWLYKTLWFFPLFFLSFLFYLFVSVCLSVSKGQRKLWRKQRKTKRKKTEEIRSATALARLSFDINKADFCLYESEMRPFAFGLSQMRFKKTR